MTAAESSIELQERDWSLMRGLLESRVMNAAHAAALYFDGSGESAKKRLGKLKAAGFIAARERRVNEPAILFLTRKAFVALKNRGILDSYPRASLPALERRSRVSELTLAHELEVMDVKAAFHSAARTGARFKIETFTTWPLLCQFEVVMDRLGGRNVPVKPDGFLRLGIEEPDGGESLATFFLEVDRSSESPNILAERADCYVEYFRSGGFARRNGRSPEQKDQCPFHVLVVLKTAERRNNIAELLLQNMPPILRQVYLATMAEVLADPVGPIWIRPIDYRAATRDTPFDAELPHSRSVYVRRVERERFVEQHARKISILD